MLIHDLCMLASVDAGCYDHKDLALRGSDKQQGILNAWVCYLRKIEGIKDL